MNAGPTTQAPKYNAEMNAAKEHQIFLEIECHDEATELPEYKRETTTAKVCIMGQALAWLLIAGCVAASI
jgi:hypothetical protein